MLLLAALLAVGSVFPRWHDGRNIDDLELASLLFQNPARAETVYLGKDLSLVARVREIRHSSGALFDVTLGPNAPPSDVASCALPRSVAAHLKRGQLVIAEGTLVREGRSRLRLRGCKIAYDFSVEPEDAGVALDACNADYFRKTCRRGDKACDNDMKTKVLPMFDAHVAGHREKAGAVACTNPLFVFIANCRRDEPRLLSCSQRSEIVGILNHVAISLDGQTREDAGDSLLVQKPERSAMLDAAIRSGALPDEEP